MSDKYTRENVATKKSDRGALAATPTEKEFVILDELKLIADELNTNVAAVALAWVRSRPGVSSTIIGARRMDQLDANLAALDVTLSADQIASLDALTGYAGTTRRGNPGPDTREIADTLETDTVNQHHTPGFPQEEKGVQNVLKRRKILYVDLQQFSFHKNPRFSTLMENP